MTRTHLTRTLLISLAATLALLALAAPAPAAELAAPLPAAATASGAESSPAWIMGAWARTQTRNCFTGFIEDLTWARTGFVADPGIGPRAGAVFYAAVEVATLGNPCTGGAQVHIEVFPPAGTRVALTTTTPVRCFFGTIDSATYSELTDGSCPQAPRQALRGGLAFDPVGKGAWPLAFGRQFWISIPLVSSGPLSGVVGDPCPSCFTAAVWSIDGVFSPWSNPTVGVQVLKATSSVTLDVTKTAMTLKAKGIVSPVHSGTRVVVRLFRKRGGQFVRAATRTPTLTTAGRYTAAFARPSRGTCKVTVTFPGDSDHLSESVKRVIAC